MADALIVGWFVPRDYARGQALLRRAAKLDPNDVVRSSRRKSVITSGDGALLDEKSSRCPISSAVQVPMGAHLDLSGGFLHSDTEALRQKRGQDAPRERNLSLAR